MKLLQKIKVYQVLLLVGAIAMFFAGQYIYKQYVYSKISSFKECAKAGLPILESYPAQCKVNGKTFTETVPTTNRPITSTPSVSPIPSVAPGAVGEPISNSASRVTKKPFGIYITPKTSPVQPEKFTGYHTGTDFETTPAETNSAVPISAICDGDIVYKNTVDGYGGVIIQSCILGGQAVTVLYGHIDITSATFTLGDRPSKGNFLANLAPGYSPASAGERKHLHLGIHIGSSIEYRGYVQNKSELTGWLNYQDLYK